MKKFFTFVAAVFVAMTMNAEAITVAEAYQIGMALDSMATSEEEYTVEGYVFDAQAFSMLYKNQTWSMADDAAATSSSFKAYNCYPVQGNDTLKVLNGDKVSVTGKLKKYKGKNDAVYTIEIEKGVATFIQMADGDHTVVSSIEEVTVARALEIGNALAAGGVTEKQYKIRGYVSAINVKSSDAYSEQYGNQSFYVADDATSTAASNAEGAFYVYRGKPSTEAEIPVGAQVEFTCTIKKYVPSQGDPVIENADQNIIITVLGDVTPVEEADVVFTSADFNGLGHKWTTEEPYGAEVTVVKDGVTFTCNSAGGDQYGVRCYQGSNVSITSAEQQIGKIVFEFATANNKYYNGDLDEEIVVNGMEWNNTMTNQARMNKISIYFGEYQPEEVDTLTVEEAIEIGMALEAGATTAETYLVRGFACTTYAPNEGYTDQTWYMHDTDATAFSNFQAYRCTPDRLVVQGDLMVVKGKIMKYVKDDKVTIEISKGTATHVYGEGIENVVLTEKAQKVVVDGVLYIVRDNKLFNLQGAQVR